MPTWTLRRATKRSLEVARSAHRTPGRSQGTSSLGCSARSLFATEWLTRDRWRLTTHHSSLTPPSFLPAPTADRGRNSGQSLDRLSADPSFVLGLTISLPSDPESGPQHNLPVPDFDETGFFGRQNELRRIMKAIKGAYPVVSILGDGGIGKTSIALKAAYELLEDPSQPFDAFVWVTAKATILTPNEIQRINGAIETSLGLIGTAAVELSGAESPGSGG